MRPAATWGRATETVTSRKVTDGVKDRTLAQYSLFFTEWEAPNDLIILFLRISQREPRVDFQRLATLVA
jgi:hypothetical protein